MKTIKLLSIIALTLVINVSFAQKKEKVDEKTRNYFTEITFESSDYNLTLKNIVSKFEYLKFAVKIENKTSDYIIWNNKDSKAIFDFGDRNATKIKTFKFKPYGGGSRTFEVRGGEEFLVKDFKFVLNGLYKVPTNGKVQKVEDFKLPESTNSIKAGDFTIRLVKSKKKTDETYAKFEVIYNGDKVLIVKPDDISVRVNDSDVFANDYKKSTPYILNKGDKMAFTAKFHIPAKVADMQFADMFIQWQDVFSISEPIEMKAMQYSIVLDEELTKEKN